MTECSITQRDEPLGRSQRDGGSAGQRIGVLTFHRCINYGSYWQAKCLVEALKAMGHGAVILDYRSPRATIKEWACALRPTLPTPVPRKDRAIYACKVRKFLAEIERLPLSPQFDLDAPDDMEPLDTIVIGSDEVWNLVHPWYGGKAAFFGCGLKTRRIISYAATFGNYSCWDGLGPPYTEMLQKLDAISVRDENSWWMLKNSLGREYPIVLDPTLLFPLQPDGSSKTPSHPYLLLYGHNFSGDFSRRVRAWAESRRLPIVSIGYRNDWAHEQWLTADPHDFSRAFAHAEGVATNFFHGCAFSLLNRKPFACEVSDYRSIKVRGLMELLGGEGHLVGDASEVGPLLEAPISAGIQSRILELREQSHSYLNDSLLGVHA